MKEILNSRIEALLNQFNFEELTSQDRSLVLSEMSEQEYSAFRQIAISASAMPSPAIPVGLRNAIHADFVKSKVAEQGLLSRLVNYKIPVWVTALCLGAFVFYILSNKNQKDALPQTPIAEQTTEPVIIYKTDTIYQEIKAEPIVITKVVEKIVYKERAQEEPFAMSNKQIDNEQEAREDLINSANFFSNIQMEDLVKEEQKGRTVSQDEDLMGILDKVEQQVMLKLN